MLPMTLTVAARPRGGSENPALHWQSAASLLPLGDCEFGMQGVHSPAPELSLYFPASHDTHVPPSGPVVPGLHRQSSRNLEAVDEFELAGQSSHESGAEPPVLGRYLPATQSRHVPSTDAPSVSEYLPAPQSRHALGTNAPRVAEYLPAAQSRQAAATDAPGAAECFPAAQAVHAAEPEVFLYLPASQSVHVWPSAPVAPGLHVHAVRRAEAGGESEPAGQGWQDGLPGGDHVPLAHGWHTSLPVAPVAAEYSPPPHCEHR